MYPSPGSSSGANAVGSVAADANNGTVVDGKCHNDHFTSPVLPFKQDKYFCNAGVYNLSSSPAAPVVSVKANGSSSVSVNQGGSVTLTWTATNASTCTASDENTSNLDNATWNWSGPISNPASGSAVVNFLQEGTQFILSCSGPGGGTNAYATVTVTAPSLQKNGNQYTVCTENEGAINDYPCTNPGGTTYVYSAQNYFATYPVSGLPAGDYTFVINYGDHASGFNPGPPCGYYNYNVNISVTSSSGPSSIKDMSLSTCGGQAAYGVTLPAGTSSITLAWSNNAFVNGPGAPPPGWDPNLRIDSFNLSQYPEPADPPIISLPSVGSAADTFYYIKLTALYKDLSVAVQGVDPTGASVQFKNAQVVADVTAKGNNALKRTKSVISYTPNYNYPEDTIESMSTLCKKLRLVLGTGGASDYQDAEYADANPDCKP
jgi:hypothetical protein